MFKFNKNITLFFVSFVVVAISTVVANAQINQDAAGRLCGTASRDEATIISMLHKAKSAKSADKIIACSLLAISIERKALDLEVAKSLSELYNLIDNEGKKFIISTLNKFAYSAATKRDSNALGIYFIAHFQNDFEIFEENLQTKYMSTLLNLTRYWKRDKATTMGSYAWGAEATNYRLGVGTERNLYGAMRSYYQSIKAHNPQSLTKVEDDRAYFCFFSVGYNLAETPNNLSAGVQQCFITLDNYPIELSTLQTASAGLGMATLMHGPKHAYDFWSEINEFIRIKGMNSERAHKYIKNRCSDNYLCDPRYIYDALSQSTAIYETSFVSASLSDRIKIQASLQKAGFYTGEIDGLWGKLTKQAVLKFSQLNNLHTSRVTAVNEEILLQFPVPESIINLHLEKVYAKIKKQERMRIENYSSAYKRSLLQRSVPSMRREPKPFLESSTGHTNIFINDTWVNCYTGGGFTMCN